MSRVWLHLETSAVSSLLRIDGVPSGGEDDFVTLREVGEKATFDFEPRDHAELGEIVAGKKPGRSSDDELIVFDSTGMALQDVAAAAAAFEAAERAGRGRLVDLLA